MRIGTFKYLFFMLSLSMQAQEEHAWVYFTDKPSATNYLEAPLTMLTQKSLDRRASQSIEFDLQDVPLEPTYVSAVANSTGITVKARSKWLNALHVIGTKENIDALLNFEGVASVIYASHALNKGGKKRSKHPKNKWVFSSQESNLAYGLASNQIEMLKGDFLHDLGYTGKGMTIALMDAGYKGVEIFDAFSNLSDGNMENGEILGGYDYVHRDTDFYRDTGNTHGLSVLSTIAAFQDTEFIGTAPDAYFYLFVTENPATETPLEESLWVEAAERADSLGVDVINTSLGYSTFDESAYDYTYADMDGATTFITRGAEIAASKGMVVVNSAGNSGNDPWHYITAPADAPSVLTVGAVDPNEETAFFSSYGPTADNRIKPEVLAQGQSVYVINGAGNTALSNGTSFSSPIIAGLVACLWQSLPEKSATEIRGLIQSSADLYLAPENQRGYGIPDFESIPVSLQVSECLRESPKIATNSVEINLKVVLPERNAEALLVVSDMRGRILLKQKLNHRENKIDVSGLNTGLYLANVWYGQNQHVFQFIKK
jgi:serine protease AprX